METYNRAVNGTYRTFTWRSAEKTFLDYNTRSAFAYMRAADALGRIHPMGVSHPAVHDLLVDARNALQDALALNTELGRRPRRRRVLLLRSPVLQAVPGRLPGVPRCERRRLRRVQPDRHAARTVQPHRPVVHPGRAREVPVPDTRRATAAPRVVPPPEPARQPPRPCRRAATRTGSGGTPRPTSTCARPTEQPQLNTTTISSTTSSPRPAERIPAEHLDGITASGPPLDVLLRALEGLRDRRLAADRDDIPTRTPTSHASGRCSTHESRTGAPTPTASSPTTASTC